MRFVPRLIVLTILFVASGSAIPHGDENENDHVSDHMTDMTGMTGMVGTTDSNSMAMPNMTMEPSPISMVAGGHQHHGRPILEDPDLEPQQRAYWEQYDTTTFLNEKLSQGKALRSWLVAHISLTLIAWIFLYPVSVSISVEKNASSLYLVLQTVQSLVAISALFCLAVYAPSSPPALYPNNAYGKMSIILFFIVVVHWISLVIRVLSTWLLKSSWAMGGERGGPIDGTEYMLASFNANNGIDDEDLHRPSHDSGHGHGSVIDENITGGNVTTSTTGLRPDIDPGYDDDDDDVDELGSLHSENGGSGTPILFESRFQEKLFSKIMKYPYIESSVIKLGQTSSIIFTLINKPLFVYSFAYLLTGIVVCYRLGMSNAIFNILAHFIKGGVFFLFGIVTLGRYCGAFAYHGMAWNIRPGSPLDNDNDDISVAVAVAAAKKKRHHESSSANSSPPPPPFYRRPSDSELVSTNIVNKFLSYLLIRTPSMEFIESGLIFIYGISNIFLEHLGNTDGAWSHKDLQHVSIAFMYIGGGLCGLLVESPTVRKLLAGKRPSREAVDPHSVSSFNPIPAFTVFWTGALMSQHQQELALSTQIHQQWGTLLSVAAVFRLLTYLLLYVSPPISTKPTHPFTELITSFCLICGGMVFIESNSQTVEAMIYRGLDSMFSLNVNVGIAVLIMSWVMVVMTIKAWVARH